MNLDLDALQAACKLDHRIKLLELFFRFTQAFDPAVRPRLIEGAKKELAEARDRLENAEGQEDRQQATTAFDSANRELERLLKTETGDGLLEEYRWAIDFLQEPLKSEAIEAMRKELGRWSAEKRMVLQAERNAARARYDRSLAGQPRTAGTDTYVSFNP